MVMPTTRCPASTRRPAAVALSTPPERATTVTGCTARRMRYIRAMRKGSVVELETEGLDAEGAATATLDGVTVHVAGAAPGERVAVRVEHRSPHRPEAWAT